MTTPKDEREEFAIVGGGIAGLTCAKVLAMHGHSAQVFDKARALGGRTTTRRRDGLQFDLGAQCFSVKDPEFKQFIDACVQDKVVNTWPAQVVSLNTQTKIEQEIPNDLLIGIPGMDALCAYLAKSSKVTLSTKITGIEQADGQTGWFLQGIPYGQDNTETFGPFAKVVIALPAPQAAALLSNHQPLAQLASSVAMAPAWTVMLALSDDSPVSFDAAMTSPGMLAWVSRDTKKESRPKDTERWVAHATTTWAAANQDADPDWVKDQMVEALCDVLDVPTTLVNHADVHRWLYARAPKPLGQAYILDADKGIGLCGDWCLGEQVEAAFLSGLKLADAMIGHDT